MSFMTRRRLTGTSVLIAAALMLPGCVVAEPETLEEPVAEGELPAIIVQSGNIRIGTSPNFPPMEYKDEETFATIGLDIDIMHALADHWGVELVLVEQPFAQLLNSVATGRVDLVMSGISDTVDRQQTVSFVDYFSSAGRFYTTSDKADRYATDEDLCGAKVAASMATDYYAQIGALSDELCVANGLPPIERLGTDSGAAARLQIEQGRTDLAVQGAENLAFFEIETPGVYTAVGSPLPAQPLGIVVDKENTALADAVLAAVEALRADGTWAEILKRWKLEDADMEPTINGVE